MPNCTPTFAYLVVGILQKEQLSLVEVLHRLLSLHQLQLQKIQHPDK